MADVIIQKEGENQKLIVSGELTIEYAAEFKNTLIQSLENAEHIILDLAKVTSVDLSCLQLLCSAHRTSLHMNRILELTADYPETVTQAVKETGFLTTCSICSQNNQTGCLWVGISKAIQCQT